MQKELLNILSNNNKDIDNQKLMDYLNGELSESEKNEVERWIADNEFAEDAVEGLQEFPSTLHLKQQVNILNRELRKTLDKKRLKRSRRKLFDNRWALISLVLVLVLAVIGYLVIRFLHTKTL